MTKTKTITQEADTFTRLVALTCNECCVKEYRFDPERRWRFDYAIPDKKIAIEVEGGVWQYGRHNRATGFVKDMEKYNRAAILGWKLLRYTPDNLLGQATQDINTMIENER